MKQVFGKETVYIRSGGSIPIVGGVRRVPGHSQRHDGLRAAGRQSARAQREVAPAEFLPRHRSRGAVSRNSGRLILLFAIPVVLSAVFLAIAARLNAFSIPLTALILAYTFAPMAVAYLARDTPPPTWLDFVIIALLWFPLEFSVGHQFIPKHAQGTLHLAAYGVSILLGSLDISVLPAALRDEIQLAAIGPRSREPVDRLRGMCAGIDRTRTRHRLPAAISPARAAVAGAHRIAIPDHPGRHRAPGRNPLPRADPELRSRKDLEPASGRYCFPRSFSDARISTMDPSRCPTGAI